MMYTETLAESGLPNDLGSYADFKIRARDLPGMRSILVGIYLTFFLLCRHALYALGVPLPLRLVSQVGNPVVFLLILAGTLRYVQSQQLGMLYRSNHLHKVALWAVMVVILAIYGVFRENIWDIVGKEALMLLFFAMFLLLGGDDRFWEVVIRHLAIIFYMAVVAILLLKDTPMVDVSYRGVEQDVGGEINKRYTNTMAYGFRRFLESGMLIGLWGLTHRSGWKTRAFQILAPFLFFALNVGLFAFRNIGIGVALVFLSFLLLRPMLERRTRPGITVVLIALSVIGTAWFITTDSWQLIMHRFTLESGTGGVFGSRDAELAAYRADMGAEIVIGRGLGGTYDATSVYEDDTATIWTTVHYGLLVFTLKGGVLFLLLFVSFLWPGLILRSVYFYQNSCNLIAAVMMPYLLYQYALTPFLLTPENVCMYLPQMMVLARFARRGELDEPSLDNMLARSLA